MDKTIKLGLAGIGRAGWGMHCRELDSRTSKFEIVAACDPDATRLRKMKERYPGIRTYDTYEAFLSDDEMEVADIATPSKLHTEHAISAIRAKKTVFLEKPIATSLEDAKKIVAESQYANVPVYFRHNRRFESCYQHVQEIIATGILGTVFEIRLHRHSYQRRRDWQTLKSEGGGQLNNWGPHIIDHSLRFLGSEVASVWSSLGNVAAAGDAEDHLKIVLTGKNGAIVDMEISGGVAVPQPTYVVFGSSGALTSDEKEIHLRYLDPDVELPPVSPIKESPPLDGSFGNQEELPWIEKTIPVSPELAVTPESIWDYLYESVREGATFPISSEEAIQVMEVVEEVKKGTRFA